MNIIRFSLLAALSLAGSIASPAESQAQGIANPGLEEGAPTPTGWRFAPARQYAVALDSVDAKEGRWAARVTGQPGGPANEFGSVSQRLEGAPLRNKRVRYRAWVRTDLAPGASFSGLWFRVDRPNGGRGFFDGGIAHAGRRRQIPPVEAAHRSRNKLPAGYRRKEEASFRRIRTPRSRP